MALDQYFRFGLMGKWEVVAGMGQSKVVYNVGFLWL